MIIHNGGPATSLSELVLFPFDDFSLPFQRGMRLHLVPYQSTAERGTRVGVSCGAPGTPDSACIYYYGAVQKVGDEYWMWYLGQGHREDDFARVCLAISQDGYHWEKPELNLVSYNGHARNNLVDLGGGAYRVVAFTALHDLEEPDPRRRFKAVYETHRRNPAHGGRAEFNVAFSPDGLTWTEEPVEPHYISCEMGGLIKFNHCYLVAAQSGGGHYGPPRKLEIFVSYDFRHWVLADCLGFMRGNIPPRPMTAYAHDGEQVHLGAGLWNRDNVIIGIYGQWHGHPSNDRRLVNIDLGLVVSNDGLHYREPIPDFRFIASSEDGMGFNQRDDAFAGLPALEQGQGFENIGDETLFWYGSWRRMDGVRVASWERDRLGYFEPFRGSKMNSLQEAHFISAPIDLEGAGVRIGMNAGGLGPHSQVAVEVLDEQFRPVRGYSGEACTWLDTSGLRQPIRWQAQEILYHASGPVRLRANIRGLRPEDIRLYAVYAEAAA